MAVLTMPGQDAGYKDHSYLVLIRMDAVFVYGAPERRSTDLTPPLPALPAGFDRRIWKENPSINNGLPYLIANPPQ